MAVLRLQFFVHLDHALADQEESPQQQDEIAAGQAVLKHRQREQRFGQSHEPRQAHQQQHAGDQRQTEPEPPGPGLLGGRQFARQDRDEDDVIDA